MTTDGEALYALKGNKTLELWRYRIGTAFARRPEPLRRDGRQTRRGGPASALGPNPLASGNVATLRYSLPAAGPATVRVFDVTGRPVLTRTLGPAKTATLYLDLRNLERRRVPGEVRLRRRHRHAQARHRVTEYRLQTAAAGATPPPALTSRHIRAGPGAICDVPFSTPAARREPIAVSSANVDDLQAGWKLKTERGGLKNTVRGTAPGPHPSPQRWTRQTPKAQVPTPRQRPRRIVTNYE